MAAPTSTSLDALLMPPAPVVPDALFVSGDGFTAAALSRMCHEGLLRPVLRGVYAACDATDDAGLRARAARSAAGRPGVLGHLTAAWVHGATDAPPAVLDVLEVRSVWVPAATGVRVHAARLSDADVVQVAGISVTSRVRTAVDLSRWLPGEEGRGVLTRLLATSLACPCRALDRLAAMDRPPHARRAREVLRQLPRRCACAGRPAAGVSSSCPR